MRLLARHLPRHQYSRKLSETVEGWAKSVQKSGANVFVKIDNGRGGEAVQVVASKELGAEVKVGCAVTASGSVQKSKGAQQETELIAEKLRVVGTDSNPRYDISADNLRKKIHLRARNPDFAALLRARSEIFHATHCFFRKNDFIHIDTPKLTRNDCEGGGEVFDVVTNTSEDVKEDSMYLSVSSQLHLEAMVSRLRKVYTLGPAFRAEKQQSHAHLSEFHMLEAEVAFIDNIEEMCSLVENYIRYIANFIESSPEFEAVGFCNSELQKYPESPFLRITYEDAVKLLTSSGQKVTAKSGLSKKNELDLVKHHGDLPLFVTYYPVEQKPFYMARTPDEKHTLSFDLLVPGVGELVGGSVREQSAEQLEKRGCGIDWYLETRRRGQPPTAGFGLGFERLLQYMLNVQNIKDTVAFPRWHRHCQC